ncbi:MAG TPA: recombinase family protein, partial [Anaerolineae bacterium]|nr:recombinase family protein [Anaerolineae bacterium]
MTERIVDARHTPDPEEAKVVRLIYDAVIQQCSLARARDAVNATGHRTKSRTLIDRNGDARTVGGRPWTHTGVKAIITRPVYRGCTCYQGEVFEGKHEKIIDGK